MSVETYALFHMDSHKIKMVYAPWQICLESLCYIQ